MKSYQFFVRIRTSLSVNKFSVKKISKSISCSQNFVFLDACPLNLDSLRYGIHQTLPAETIVAVRHRSDRGLVTSCGLKWVIWMPTTCGFNRTTLRATQRMPRWSAAEHGYVRFIVCRLITSLFDYSDSVTHLLCSFTWEIRNRTIAE